MSTPSEIWNDILKNNVEKDDPLWKEYLDKAAVFDVRMVDEWNKIVDVLLVYVALFISVLTSFIIQTFTRFQRNPADITNDLLVAVYNQLVAQSNNIPIPPVDPRSYFNQPKADYDAAVIQNALLYTSLSLSIVVSVIALVAKLWLVSYSHQAFSVGSPYDRAMKRQEAYGGVLVWNLGGVINILPVILLIALFLFGFYVYASVYPVQKNIALTIEGLFIVGMLSLGFTSAAGALFPGCPFRSAFSSVIENFQTLSKRTPCRYLATKRLRWLWIAILIIFWIASSAAVAYTSLKFNKFFLLLSPSIVPLVYSAQQEVVHRPQKYKISHLAAWVILFASLLMIIGIYFESPIFVVIYITIALAVVFACWMLSKVSKSMADTGEIDAIAWLLITTPPQHPATFFKKAGQMTGFDSIGRHYRPRLLESLVPLLTLLITSYHDPDHRSSDAHSPSSKPRRNFKIELKREQSDGVSNGRYDLPTSLSLVDDDGMAPIDEGLHLKNLEIYTACLARLSEFEDCKGSLWCLWEDTMHHPKLEQPLIDKLLVLANPRHHFQAGLRSAATKVLNNYGLDMKGNPVRNSATAVPVRSVATVLRSAATISMMNVSGLNSQEVDSATRVVPADSSEEMKHEIGDSGMC